MSSMHMLSILFAMFFRDVVPLFQFFKFHSGKHYSQMFVRILYDCLCDFCDCCMLIVFAGHVAASLR